MAAAADRPEPARWRTAVALAALLSVACENEPKPVWVAFNAEDQTFEVEVLPSGSPVGEDLELELLSNLGRTVVGSALVSPGSGPVGTEHLVAVDVLDDFEEIVERVTVDVRSQAVKDLDGDGEPDSRGEGEFELDRDSADPGAWAITMQSLGADDERRTDRFTIGLWQKEVLADLETAE